MTFILSMLGSRLENRGSPIADTSRSRSLPGDRRAPEGVAADPKGAVDETSTTALLA